MLKDVQINDCHYFLLNFSLHRGWNVLKVEFNVQILLYWSHMLKEEVFLMLVLVFEDH